MTFSAMNWRPPKGYFGTLHDPQTVHKHELGNECHLRIRIIYEKENVTFEEAR